MASDTSNIDQSISNDHGVYDEDSDINANHNTNNNNNNNNNNNGSSEIYCICRGPDDGTHMVQCGDCTEWFHSRCLDYTKKEVESLKYADQFLCPNDCQGLNHAKKKQLEEKKRKKKKATKSRSQSKTKSKSKRRSKRNNTRKKDNDSMDEDSTSTASSNVSSKENHNGTRRRERRSRNRNKNKNKNRACNEDINIVLTENDNNVDVMTAMHSIDRMIKGLEETTSPEEDLLSRYNISFESEYDDIDTSGPFQSEGDIIKVMIEKLKQRNAKIDELKEIIKEYEEQKEEMINLKEKIKEYEEQKIEVMKLKRKQSEDKEQLNRKWEAEIERMSNRNIKLIETKDDKINELQAVIVETERNKNEEIHSLNNDLQSAKEEILSLQKQLQENTEKEDKDDSQKSDKTNDTNDTDKTDITLTKTIPSFPSDLISPLSTTTQQRASTVIESQSSNDNDIDIDMTNDESQNRMEVDQDMNEPEAEMINSCHSSSGEWWQCESCGFENDPNELVCQICTTQNTQMSQM